MVLNIPRNNIFQVTSQHLKKNNNISLSKYNLQIDTFDPKILPN